MIQQTSQGSGVFGLKRPFAAYVTRNSHRRLREREKNRRHYRWECYRTEKDAAPRAIGKLVGASTEPRRLVAQFKVAFQ
jgi:hypothetical protein